MTSFYHRLIGILLCLIVCAPGAYALTAEQVLGEYWKDPLFGQAATEHTILLEVLHRRIWPLEVTVPTGKNIRFVVENKTDEMHMIAFSKEPQALLADKDFKQFIKDELYHAEQKAKQSAAGHHSHNTGNAVDETQDIVKTLDQRPTIFVLGQEQKEMLILFTEEDEISIFCALDGHDQKGYVSRLVVQAQNSLMDNDSVQK